MHIYIARKEDLNGTHTKEHKIAKIKMKRNEKQSFLRQMPSNRQNVLIKSRGKMQTLIGISLLNKSTCHSGRFACILKKTSINAASTQIFYLQRRFICVT